MAGAKVYFTKEITPQAMIRMYQAMGVVLPGRVAVKLHSGEVGNQNFLRPDFMKPVIDHVNGTIVECNTAYEGQRNTTKAHRATMKLHGWSSIAEVDIMDEAGEMELPVPEGRQIKRNFVGSNLKKYDSMLVLSHFKGHPMGGFGGALKNISIGIASSHGKAYIHGAGNEAKIWSADHDSFLESMADAAKSIVNYFGEKIVFINVMKNMSVDCDCCAVAEDPCMGDIGIVASTDPIAIDQACLDAVINSDDPGRDRLLERINSKNGMKIIDDAVRQGYGTKNYELIVLD